MPHSLLALTVASVIACSPSGDQPSKPPAFDMSDPASAVHEAEQRALAHVQAGDRMLGVEDLVVRRTVIDRMGIAHTRLDQVLGGIGVFGAQAIVHVPADGHGIGFTDNLVRNLQVDTRPTVSEDQALAIALSLHGAPVERSLVDLQILRHQGEDHLTWRVQLWSTEHPGTPSMPILFVDAHSGSLVWQYDNLQTAEDRQTHDAGNGSSLPGSLARDEGDGPVGDTEVDNAHDFAGVTWDYYDTFLGRDSFDGAGSTIGSVVHYGNNYNNAFWNGTYLVYGDGDGTSTFDPLCGGLDVVGHEFTHGVTQWTASLIYSGQSGGLNEATSDIMGAVIEAYNDGWTVSADTWNVGEDITLFATALRYMDNPTADGRSLDDFDNYSDGIDVHYSSGIANRAFVEWEADAALDIEAAGNIWFRALQYYMAPSTTFPEARLATEQAAMDLFGRGSDEVAAVSAGWDLVDVPAGLLYVEFDAVTGISLSAGGTATYSFTPDANASAVRFTVEGDDGDADMFVRHNSTSASDPADCESTSADSFEACTLDPLQAGAYSVTIDAFTTFNNATMRAWEGCEDVDGDGFTVCENDCNDADPAVNPDAVEVCNTIDDNCDGATDGPDAADLSTWYADTDGDDFGDAKAVQQACVQPQGYVVDATDCDDLRKDVNPGAPEVCDPADVDEDCDGVGDEADDAVGTVELLIDGDGDGYGEAGNVVFACQTGDGIVALDGDCDDGDDTRYPSAPEDCIDRRDTNCDGLSGADDLDADGFAVCDECDDGNKLRYPGAAEVCDGIDNDCNDAIDDQATDALTWFVDDDGDGFGGLEVRDCVQPEGTALVGGDCDDADADAFPGAPEVADDAVDQDCDGEDLVTPGQEGVEKEQALGGGCGCDSTAPTSVGWLMLGLGALVGRRRRLAR